jgi:hypothetical protein
MFAGRHLPTAIQLINQENELFKHHKKLEEIHRGTEKRKKVLDKDTTVKAKLFETRERGLKFHNSEKQFAIEKDNELLLGRLVEISRKKKPNLFPVPVKVKTEAVLPKSLHGPSRRREKDRIAMENEAFARRLLSQQPSFNRRKLENDFEKHQSRVKNMQKLVVYSPRKIKLPPLRTTEFEKPKSNEGKRAEKPKRPTKKNDIIEVDEAKEVDERKTTVVGETAETKRPEEHIEEPKEEVPIEEEANVNHTNQQIPNENNETSPQQIEGQNQSQANLNNERSPDNKPEGQDSKGGSVVEPGSSS